MGNLNKVLLIGRLGQDPEKRITQAGASVVTLNLATSDYWKDRNGNRKERTEWHKVVLWNNQADFAEQYLKKGNQVYVEGSLQTREWQDRDGNKRYSTEIKAISIQSLESRAEQQNQNSGFPGENNYSSSQPQQNNHQNHSMSPDGQGYQGSQTPTRDDQFIQ